MTYTVQAFARLTRVTVRTLHHYDRLGLLVPRRQAGERRDRPGHRVYSDRDLERLEPILALRTLGFSLRTIAGLLEAPGATLPQALRLQRTLLVAKRWQLDRAVAAVDRALTKRRPSAALLAEITRELNQMPENSDWTDKYYSVAAKAKIKAAQPSFTPAMQEEVSRKWADLTREVEAAMAEGAAAKSARVQALATRWRALITAFTQGDAEVAAGLRKLWADRANWPEDMRERTASFNPKLMTFMQRALTCVVALALAVALPLGARAQVPGSLEQDLRTFVSTPAVSGYEATLDAAIAKELAALHPTRDNLGDVMVTVGEGAPYRLLGVGLDEPGYIVSGITDDGYLRLRRLPTRGRLPLFNALWSAQPVRVGRVHGAGYDDRYIGGVVTGLSVHLQPGRIGGPDPDDIDNMYVDIGAKSAAEVRRAGVDILSPVALERSLQVEAGGQLTGFSIGDRAAAAVLVDVLRHVNPSEVHGTVTVAFVNQHLSGDRGWHRVMAAAPQPYDTTTWMGTVPVAWAATPGATVQASDLTALAAKMEAFLGEPAFAPALPAAELLPEPELPSRSATAPAATTVLADLVAQYGVNPHEARVAEAIRALLPAWAHTTTDDAGNIVLHWDDAAVNAPRLLFVAHQDEIGFDVQAIGADGTLTLRTRGGGDLDFYVGHPIYVHTAQGMRPGVLELPEGWDKAGFKFDRRTPLHATIGASSAEQVTQLGVAVGDMVTIPKQYRRLLGDRATARSFDDRVGDTALIEAAWVLGPSLPGRDVTFVWSTGEEIGLVGAGALAKRLNTAGREPNYVFAVDTFVSSDTPLESHRFADTPIGDGFVIRAVDDSSITPWPIAQRMRALALAAKIPVQWGTTGGGNDGSVFLPFGSVDLPIGWPLRTSHSPGEIIDTRDLESLTGAIELYARRW